MAEDLSEGSRLRKFKRGSHASDEAMAKDFAALDPDQREDVIAEMKDQISSDDPLTLNGPGMRRASAIRERLKVLRNVDDALRRAKR